MRKPPGSWAFQHQASAGSCGEENKISVNSQQRPLNPTGPKHHFYDAYETVTDEEGNFFIPGKGIRLFVDLDPVNVYVFKAGYSYLRSGWDSLKEGLIIRDKIQWEGKRAIIPLRKLTDEERLRGSMPAGPIIHPKYRRLFDKEINKVRIERGARPLPIGDDNR